VQAAVLYMICQCQVRTGQKIALLSEWGVEKDWICGVSNPCVQHLCCEPFNQLGHHGQIYQPSRVGKEGYTYIMHMNDTKNV
jgi:hypothetical protein